MPGGARGTALLTNTEVHQGGADDLGAGSEAQKALARFFGSGSPLPLRRQADGADGHARRPRADRGGPGAAVHDDLTTGPQSRPERNGAANMGALDRVAIITGAGRGIGSEHLLLFASRGPRWS